MTLRLGLLGPFRVWADGAPVDVPAGRLRALLATLALSAGQPVSVDRLATAVWGEDATVDARVNLQSNVLRLRRLLGAGLVATRGGGYALAADPDDVDALRFVRLLDEAAAAADPDTQRDALARALALWRGTPFEGVRSDWLEHTQAQRLQERYLAALERRVDLDLAGTGPTGAVAGLVAELGELTGRYPLREPLWVRLLVALERAGRPAEALERYAAVRVRLAEELGADPGPELRRVHADLLAGRPPRLPGTAAPAALRVVPRQLPAGTDAFTGRAAALKVLDGLVNGEDDLGAGARPVVVAAIAGTAGIGKTTLAVHWTHRVAGRFPDGQLYVNLRGFDPSGSPLAPAEAVRGFLEALQVPPQQVPAGLDAQAGLYRSLLAGRRVLVLLDNARDAAQALPLLPGAPGCLAIVTSRNQLPGLVAAGAHPITLDLLGPGEALELLARRLSPDRVAAQPAAAAELVARCAGLPLALAIVAARAATRPDLPLAALAGQLRGAAGGLDGLEAGDAATSARAVFSWSYRSLGDPAARLFRLLGLHPGPDAATAAAASLAGVPVSQARPPLAELTRAHLLAEPTPGRYAFHDLLRAYAAELAGDADAEADRRAATGRLLDHYLQTASAADALLFPHHELRPHDPPAPGTAVERLGDPDAALAWFTAEREALLAAVRHAGRGGFDRHACRLAAVLDVFLHRRGHWHERASVHETAVAAAGRLGGGTEQGRAHRDFARALADLGRFEDADRHFRAALDRLVAVGDLAGQASVHYERNHVYALQGRVGDALAAAREAHRLYVAAGDEVSQASALTDVGWHHGQLGDREQAVTLLRQSLAFHERLGNRPYQAHTWSCLGDTYVRSGDNAQAITCYGRCLELFQDVGDRYGEASTYARLAGLHRAAGDPAASQASWQHARDILDALDPPAAAQLWSLLDQRAHP